MEIKNKKEFCFPKFLQSNEEYHALKIYQCVIKRTLNVIFNKIIVQLECKEVGQVWDEDAGRNRF